MNDGARQSYDNAPGIDPQNRPGTGFRTHLLAQQLADNGVIDPEELARQEAIMN